MEEQQTKKFTLKMRKYFFSDVKNYYNMLIIKFKTTWLNQLVVQSREVKTILTHEEFKIEVAL